MLLLADANSTRHAGATSGLACCRAMCVFAALVSPEIASPGGHKDDANYHNAGASALYNPEDPVDLSSRDNIFNSKANPGEPSYVFAPPLEDSVVASPNPVDG